MGIFNRLQEPVFLRESNNAEIQLEALKELKSRLNAEGQVLIAQDIRCLECGIEGEKNIAFELKNSHIPMYVLHDIYLESEDLSAQIDYLVFTKKLCFVIECKKLYGNIEINSAGDFIRTMEFGNRKKKEGLYSPITQNQRHLELMKKIRRDEKGNFFTKTAVDKYFFDFYKSIVVLANPKTVLNTKYAKKDIKNQVIRADQLAKYILETCNNSKADTNSDENMLKWAQKYLSLHKEVNKDYTAKYKEYVIEESKNNTEIEELELFRELKAYRLKKSREENIKPYYLFNDLQLKDLIAKVPKTDNELMQVSGFGQVKIDKYGKDILKIIENHINT